MTVNDWRLIFPNCCLAWLCCLQPVTALLVGVFIGRHGGITASARYLHSILTAPREK